MGLFKLILFVTLGTTFTAAKPAARGSNAADTITSFYEVLLNTTNFDLKGTEFIIGGTPAKKYAWPWQVLIFVDLGGGRGTICGGSIIADQWILTAAHCLDSGQPAFSYTVFAGFVDLKNLANAQQKSVTRVIQHPKYNNVGKDDVGLIKLSSPLSYSRGVQKVILPTTDDNAYVTKGSQLTVTGWGATSTVNQDISEVLMQVTLTVRGSVNGLCDTNGEICTGGPQTQKSAYFGDSGGPLVGKTGSNWFQFGVVSGSKTYPNIPEEFVVFVRISKQCSWIKEITGLNICTSLTPTTSSTPKTTTTAHKSTTTVPKSDSTSETNSTSTSSSTPAFAVKSTTPDSSSSTTASIAIVFLALFLNLFN